MPNLIDQPSQYKRNSLEFKQNTTIRRIMLRKAGYEGEALADVVTGKRLARRGMLDAKDAATFAIYSRELDRWIERERVLLRIKAPGVEHPREQAAQSSKSPTIYEVSPTSAPAVMHDASASDQYVAPTTEPATGAPVSPSDQKPG